MKNSWHTKEWKMMRDARIGGECEQCGATDSLVLQHLWHPPKFQKVRREAAHILGLKEESYEVWQEAKKLYKANQERYLSGDDTITLCKKCAFLWDKHGLILCKDCKEHYHPLSDGKCKYCKEEQSNSSYGTLFDGIE